MDGKGGQNNLQIETQCSWGVPSGWVDASQLVDTVTQTNPSLTAATATATKLSRKGM